MRSERIERLLRVRENRVRTAEIEVVRLRERVRDLEEGLERLRAPGAPDRVGEIPATRIRQDWAVGRLNAQVCKAMESELLEARGALESARDQLSRRRREQEKLERLRAKAGARARKLKGVEARREEDDLP